MAANLVKRRMAQSKLWNAIWLQGTGAPRARRCSHEPGRETGIQADSYRTRVRREAAHTDSAAVLHMRRRCLPLAPHSNTPPRYRTAGIFSISSYCTFSKRFVFWTSEHAGGPLRPKAYVIKPAVDKLKKNMLLFPARTAAGPMKLYCTQKHVAIPSPDCSSSSWDENCTQGAVFIPGKAFHMRRRCLPQWDEYSYPFLKNWESRPSSPCAGGPSWESPARSSLREHRAQG